MTRITEDLLEYEWLTTVWLDIMYDSIHEIVNNKQIIITNLLISFNWQNTAVRNSWASACRFRENDPLFWVIQSKSWPGCPSNATPIAHNKQPASNRCDYVMKLHTKRGSTVPPLQKPFESLAFLVCWCQQTVWSSLTATSNQYRLFCLACRTPTMGC